MSKSANRGSLIGLKAGLPGVPKVAPVATTAEMEERILGAAAAPVYTDVFTPVKTSGIYASRRESVAGAPNSMIPPLPRKEPTVLMNAKLPLRLHARLKRTAQFNDISMTEILIRAIEAELTTGRYEPPAGNMGIGR